MTEDYSPPDEAPRILHHDAQIVVAEKPAGLLSVPGRGAHLADCLIARLARVFPEVLLVHRLDRDTSGVMIFALTPAAQRALSAEFEARRTKKVYLARVWGAMAGKAGRIDLPLIVDWPNRPRQKVDHAEGRPSVTDWRAVRVEAGTTRVRLMPVTGRTHQLRVHMAAIGHPILGDTIYAEGAARDFPRLMLHAESLRIRHPEAGKSFTFKAAAPF
jgi:tRNA pseudouridine32 synthase / 23S rRNA pseudouridine746 synthase